MGDKERLRTAGATLPWGPGPLGHTLWQTVHCCKVPEVPCKAMNLMLSLGCRLGAMAWVLS